MNLFDLSFGRMLMIFIFNHDKAFGFDNNITFGMKK